MTRTGGCACGAIRFQITAPLMGSGACHCTDCQKASGGGPNYIVMAPREAFRVTQGTPKLFVKQGDSGGEASRAFCPDCGTPLFSTPPERVPFVIVKIGALDDASDVTPVMHVYTSSAPAWHHIPPGAPAFPKMPPM